MRGLKESCSRTPESSCRVYLYWDPRKVDSRKSWRKEWCRRTRYQKRGHGIFCRRSFRELHSTDYRMPSLKAHRRCRYLKARNQQFWYFYFRLEEGFPVSNLCDRCHSDGCILRHLSPIGRTCMLLPPSVFFAWRYDRIAHRHSHTPWLRRAVSMFQWSRNK